MTFGQIVFVVYRVTPNLVTVVRGSFVSGDGELIAYRGVSSDGTLSGLVRSAKVTDVYEVEDEARCQTLGSWTGADVR